MKITFNSKGLREGINKISSVGGTTIKVEILADKVNQQGECFAVIAASDGMSVSSVKVVCKADEKEPKTFYFGKEFIEFTSKISQFAEKVILNGKQNKAELVCGACKIDLAYKMGDEISAFVDIRKEDVLGMLAIEGKELKRAINQGAFCATSQNSQGTYMEEVYFVPIIREENSELMVETFTSAIGTVCAAPLLGAMKGEGVSTIPSFAINVKRIGTLSHLDGEKVAITISKSNVVFATSFDKVVLPLNTQVDGSSETISAPAVHSLYFNDEGRELVTSLKLNKNELYAAITTAQAVSQNTSQDDEAYNKIIIEKEGDEIAISSKNGNSKVKIKPFNSDFGDFDAVLMNPTLFSKCVSVSEKDYVVIDVNAIKSRSIIIVKYDEEKVGGCFIAPLIK